MFPGTLSIAPGGRFCSFLFRNSQKTIQSPPITTTTVKSITISGIYVSALRLSFHTFSTHTRFHWYQGDFINVVGVFPKRFSWVSNVANSSFINRRCIFSKADAERRKQSRISRQLRQSEKSRLPLGIQDPTNVCLSLNSLHDNPGAKKRNVKRLGRGIGSGKGKTCGRGHKGQKARSGGPKPAGFEGGQTPLWRRMRKFGFKNVFKRDYAELNLSRLKDFILTGRIDPTQVITMKVLKDSKCVKRIKHGVKLLGRGESTWNLPVNIEVSQVTSTAREVIEKAGGSVKTIYYNRVGLRYLLHPEKFDMPIKMAVAPPKLRGKFDYWGQDLPDRYRVLYPPHKPTNQTIDNTNETSSSSSSSSSSS